MVYGISGTGNTFKNLILDNDRDGWYKGVQYSDEETIVVDRYTVTYEELYSTFCFCKNTIIILDMP